MNPTAGPGAGGAPPGWYPDPWNQAPLRWWDGTVWTPNASWAGAASAGGAWQSPSSLADRVDQEERFGEWHRRALLAWPFVVAAGLFMMAAMVESFADFFRDAINAEDPDTIELPGTGALQGVNLLISPLSVGMLVLRLVWFGNAASVARGLGVPARRTTGWAVAGWLIPVVNFWWPYQGMRDLTPAGDPARRAVGLWWACYLVATLGTLVVVPFAIADVGWPVRSVVCVALSVPAFGAAFLERRIVAAVAVSHRGAMPRPTTL